jgi:hypothetical protein
MKPMIGLLNDGAAMSPTVEQLRAAGFAEERINILTEPGAVTKLLGCDPACVMKHYTAWGAVIGGGIYAVFGVVAGLCQCGFIHLGREYGILAFFGALLAGTLIGGVIGALAGVGEAEKDTQLYVQGVNFGGMIITVQVTEKDIELVERILTAPNVLGLKMLNP